MKVLFWRPVHAHPGDGAIPVKIEVRQGNALGRGQREGLDLDPGRARQVTSEWLVTLNALLGRGQPLYLAVYIGMIVFFAFFYTAIVFNPEDTADNLRKYGGYVPWRDGMGSRISY